MSGIDSILGEVSGGGAFYDPALDTGGVMLPEGDYYAHVKEVSIKENVVVKSKFLSDIYNLTFTVAKENADNSYGDISGIAFVGKDIKSKGFFRFKTPDKSKYPNLSENAGSNKGFMSLLDGLSIPSNKREVDGRTLFELPMLSSVEADGLPAIVKVVHDKWVNRDGEDVTTPKVVAIYNWKTGVKKEAELPF
jgi:hypothetical protein